MLDWAIGRNVGFSKFVSLGNKADIVGVGHPRVPGRRSVDPGDPRVRGEHRRRPPVPARGPERDAPQAGHRREGGIHRRRSARRLFPHRQPRGVRPRLRGGVPAGAGCSAPTRWRTSSTSPSDSRSSRFPGGPTPDPDERGRAGDPRGGHGGAARHSPRRGLRLPSGADTPRVAAHGEPGEPGRHHRGRPRGPVRERALGAPGRAVGRRRPRPADAAGDDAAGGDRESDRFRLRRLRQDRVRLLPRGGDGGLVAPDPQRRRRPQLPGSGAGGADALRDASILRHPLGGPAGEEEAPSVRPENAERLVGEALAAGRRALGEEESRGILEAYGSRSHATPSPVRATPPSRRTGRWGARPW